MKLLNRTPTEEMLGASGGKLYVFQEMARFIWETAYDAAPTLKVDMEPVAWILPTDPVRIVDHMNFNANYGGTVKELYSAEQLATLLSEQDYEYNRKTNSLIERHADQLVTLRGKAEVLQAENERLYTNIGELCTRVDALLADVKTRTAERDNLREILRELWARQDPDTWQDAFVKEVEEALAKIGKMKGER